MNKKNIVLIVALIVVIVAILFLTKILNNSKIERNLYEIKYYYNNMLYEIESKEDYINVTSKRVINCNVPPCEPLFNESFKVEYTDEYNDFFKRVFKDRKTNSITIPYDKITEEDEKILIKIIGVNTYDIIGSSDNSKYVNRGYYLEKMEDGSYLLTVAMGGKNSGGYNISINDVLLYDDTTIYVYEIYPELDEFTTEVLTYPIAQVKFSKKPKKINVLNSVTYEEFNKVELD